MYSLIASTKSLFARLLWIAIASTVSISAAYAGVLPEDRADVMYHSYSGGNVEVTGPSVLVRKKFGEQLSVSGNYYVDMVTSASIDVQVLGASQYKEERTQVSGSLDYLRGKTTYSLNYVGSSESDYQAKTAAIGMSEDMFGDLTTVSLGYSRAWDQVFKNVKQANGALVNEPTYGGPDKAYRSVDHTSYRLGVSQIITKHLILGLNYESQSHEGQLSNPYRAIRYLSLGGVEVFAEEVYPNTRITNAGSIDARYFLPYRAAVHASYRYFADTWGVTANTFEVGYTHPWRDTWIFDGAYRYHTQKHADFYSDLFTRPNQQNFMARDRNLSTMADYSVHLAVSYELTKPWSWLEKGSVNVSVDHVQFNYADFRDARMSKTKFTNTPTAVGEEPFYEESANIIRFFVSVWF
jgi:Protein of unknown function (DUF3570)